MLQIFVTQDKEHEEKIRAALKTMMGIVLVNLANYKRIFANARSS